MIRNKRRAAGVAADPDTQADAPRGGAGALLDDLAGSAAQVRQAAARMRHEAQDARDHAESMVTAAREEATRIVEAAEARARPLIDSARRADSQAAKADEAAQYLEHGAELEDQAAAADKQAEVLAAEREALMERLAALDDQVTSVTAERDAIAARLAGARERAEVAAIAEARHLLDAAGDALEALSGQRDVVIARAEAIGTGKGGGELAAVRATAGGKRAALRKVLNSLDPSRPEALADKLAATLAANLERIAEQAAHKPQPRQIVHLG